MSNNKKKDKKDRGRDERKPNEPDVRPLEGDEPPPPPPPPPGGSGGETSGPGGPK